MNYSLAVSFNSLNTNNGAFNNFGKRNVSIFIFEIKKEAPKNP